MIHCIFYRIDLSRWNPFLVPPCISCHRADDQQPPSHSVICILSILILSRFYLCHCLDQRRKLKTVQSMFINKILLTEAITFLRAKDQICMYKARLVQSYQDTDDVQRPGSLKSRLLLRTALQSRFWPHVKSFLKYYTDESQFSSTFSDLVISM